MVLLNDFPVGSLVKIRDIDFKEFGYGKGQKPNKDGNHPISGKKGKVVGFSTTFTKELVSVEVMRRRYLIEPEKLTKIKS